MGISKKDLDDLFAKAGGVGVRTARKLHAANGTDSTPAKEESAKPRGHGSPSAVTPDFGDDF